MMQYGPERSVCFWSSKKHIFLHGIVIDNTCFYKSLTCLLYQGAYHKTLYTVYDYYIQQAKLALPFPSFLSTDSSLQERLVAKA